MCYFKNTTARPACTTCVTLSASVTCAAQHRTLPRRARRNTAPVFKTMPVCTHSEAHKASLALSEERERESEVVKQRGRAKEEAALAAVHPEHLEHARGALQAVHKIGARVPSC